jgi:xanthine dehydrogenase accessory factor
MREQRQIVERWHQGSAMILVTLVRVQGSSYRQPGARLVVCKDGTYEGSISGGCLEADLLRKAAWLTRDGAAVERYSTLFDETADIPFGLGCGGVLDVLLESVDSAECQALLLAVESTLSGHEHLVATWLPKDDEGMMRAVFRADGELIFASNGHKTFYGVVDSIVLGNPYLPDIGPQQCDHQLESDTFTHSTSAENA